MRKKKAWTNPKHIFSYYFTTPSTAALAQLYPYKVLKEMRLFGSTTHLAKYTLTHMLYNIYVK